MSLLWVFLAVLAFVVGVAYRVRIHEEIARRGELTDEQVRRIEQTGSVEAERGPLDLDEIERAEEEFWEESWDEPEPW